MTEETKQTLRYSKKNLEKITKEPFEDDYLPSHQLGPDYIMPAENFSTININEGVKLRLPLSLDEITQPISLVTFMQRAVDTSPDKIALSVKREDQWIHWTYAEYWDEIKTIAKAFIKLGLERFHVVSNIGFNSPEWLISCLAAVVAGGVTTGIYTTSSPNACEYILKDSNSNIVVVENELQLKKILKIKENLAHLKTIVQYTGIPNHEDVFSWTDLKAIGNSVPDDILERRIKSLAINQCCVIVYTSGTTGNPKGVMLSHDNIIRLTHFICYCADLDKITELNLKIVSYLPLNHLAGMGIDLFLTILFQGHVFFAQPDALKGSLGATLQEVQPTLFGGVPRVFEKIKEKFEEAFMNMNFFKKILLHWAMECGYSHSLSLLNNSPCKPFGYFFAEKILNKIRQQMGLGNALYLPIGGAPITDELMEFFLKLELILLESYGLTESTGPICINSLTSYRTNSAGKIWTEFNEVKIENPDSEGNGEICIRGRQNFMGYLNDEESTKDALDSDGWCHSGDIGRIDDDGCIYITGRIKEIVITAGGENISPYPIEEAVKNELPIISQAVVTGDKRKYLTMLLTLKTNIDSETLTPLNTLSDVSINWCRRNGSEANTVQDILDDPDLKVMKAIQEGIDAANKKAISNACRIQKWKILPKNFSLQEGELSNTMKLKRFYIQQKYEKIIDEMY